MRKMTSIALAAAMGATSFAVVPSMASAEEVYFGVDSGAGRAGVVVGEPRRRDRVIVRERPRYYRDDCETIRSTRQTWDGRTVTRERTRC